MAILDVQHIEKHFGATRVLEDISFDLEQGQALAIIGSSGSGKTTLLRCINFLGKADEGQMTIGDMSIDFKTAKKKDIAAIRAKSGFVFQNYCLFNNKTALENVMLAGELLAKEQPGYKANKKAIHAQLEQQARELLAQMGLSERAGHYPHQLSGGMLQRCMIALTLALRPALVVADEPTSALDACHQQQGLRCLADVARDASLIFVSHDLGAVQQLADDVLVMQAGRCVEYGRAAQLFDAPRHACTRHLVRTRLALWRGFRQALGGR